MKYIMYPDAKILYGRWDIDLSEVDRSSFFGMDFVILKHDYDGTLWCSPVSATYPKLTRVRLSNDE